MDISKVIGSAKAKADNMLNDFNKALPIMKDLGLTVGKVGVDMGIFPCVRASLQGSIDSINPDKIKQLMLEYPNNKIVMTILKALHTAANIQSVVEGIPFKGVEVRVKLGIIPNVKVGFIRDGMSTMVVEPQKIHGTDTPYSGGAERAESVEAA